MAGALRGVNLGGWLLLEKWMTPSLFAGTNAIDEYTFMQAPGAAEKIERHRQTFITEEDFMWLHAHGIEALRIPVGYWVLEGGGPYLAAVKYLDFAMEMAAKYSLQVIIDVHGLQGSQNGRDHSGRIGRANWLRHKAYRAASIETLAQVAGRYKEHENFWGLEVINEPRMGLFQCKLRRYYKAAYVRLDHILEPHTRLIYSDAFTPRLLACALGRPTHPVAMDVHIYHMTTLFSQYLSVDWFLGKTKRRARLLERLSKMQPIIIGEWSGVLRGTTMLSVPRDEQVALFKTYVELQQEVFNSAAAWFYWSYKTEQPGQWNFRSQVEAGLISL